MVLSDLALTVIGVLKIHGPLTAEEIVEKVGSTHLGPILNVRSVRALMPHLRGANVVDDGSTATPIPVYHGLESLRRIAAGEPANYSGFAHTSPPDPIRWRLLDRSAWADDVHLPR